MKEKKKKDEESVRVTTKSENEIIETISELTAKI